jgi:Uncharacterised protein family (UPF0183)
MPTVPPVSLLAIQPGVSLGPLRLGVSLFSTLATLLNNRSIFPRVNISYSSANPVADPIYIELEASGIRLRFDGESQRLGLIEVTEFGPLGLLYHDRNLRYSFMFALLILVAMAHRPFALYMIHLAPPLRAN